MPTLTQHDPGLPTVCRRCGEWLFWRKTQWTTEDGRKHSKRRCWIYRVPTLDDSWVTPHILLSLATLPLLGGWVWVALAHAVIEMMKRRRHEPGSS